MNTLLRLLLHVSLATGLVLSSGAVGAAEPGGTRRAAERGDREAQRLLATQLHDADEATDADRSEAILWWSRAARQGDAESQFRIGKLYWNGHSLDRDLLLGYAWVSLAASEGMMTAVETEGRMREHLSISQITQARRLAMTLVDTQPYRPEIAITAEEGGDGTEDRDIAESEPVPESLPTPGSDGAPALAPVPMPRPTPTPAAAAADGWQIQLGSFRDSARAQRFLEAIRSQEKNLLGDRAPRMLTHDAGPRGTWHRVRVTSYESREEATQACALFEYAGRDCVVIRPETREELLAGRILRPDPKAGID